MITFAMLAPIIASGGGGGGGGPTPGGHRYWRVFVDANVLGTYCSIAEIEMRESPGGADQTSSANAISGYERSGFPATEAFDNIVSGNNAWSFTTQESDASNRWVGQDFGTDKAIVEFTIATRADGFSSTHPPEDFRLQYSDDGVTWTTLITVTGEGDWDNGETRVFS